jgi:hypothetical protein
MTKEERRVKKYIDAWCEGKRVQSYYCLYHTYPTWNDEHSIKDLVTSLYCGTQLRTVKGKRT